MCLTRRVCHRHLLDSCHRHLRRHRRAAAGGRVLRVRGARVHARRLRTADHDRQAARRRRMRGSARTSPTTRSTTSPSRTPVRPRAWPAAAASPSSPSCSTESTSSRPRAPERDVSRHYRRWAFESAALDLALRQAGTNLAAALGREPRPLNFVSSMRLGGFGEDERSSIEPLLARLAVYPDPALQARPDQRLGRRADRRAGRRPARSTRSTSRASTKARRSTSRPTRSSTRS